MEKLDINACFSFAWETFKKRPWFFVGITAFIFLLSALSSFVQHLYQSTGMNVTDGISFLLSLTVAMYIAFGQTNLFLKAHDAVEAVHFRDFWKLKEFGWFYLVSLLGTLIIIVGFILFIIPGIILSIVLMFATYIVVDREMKPIEALKESARLTEGHRWMLLLFSLELVAINLLGVLLLVVGLLVTIPVSILATIHAYRMLQTLKNPEKL
jgi:uncharacterized membrane protein